MVITDPRKEEALGMWPLFSAGSEMRSLQWAVRDSERQHYTRQRVTDGHHQGPPCLVPWVAFMVAL